MNEEAIKKLQEITKKEIDALTPADIDFLKARKSYLTKSEMEYYKSVIEPEKKSKKSE